MHSNQRKIDFDEIKSSLKHNYNDDNPHDSNRNYSSITGNNQSHVDSSSYLLRENQITQKGPFYPKDKFLNSIYEDNEYPDTNKNGLDLNPSFGFFSTDQRTKSHIRSFEKNPTFKNFKNFSSNRENPKENQKSFFRTNPIGDRNGRNHAMGNENNDHFLLGSFKSGITETFGFQDEIIQPGKLEETKSEIGGKYREECNVVERDWKTPANNARRVTRENFLQYMKANKSKSSHFDRQMVSDRALYSKENHRRDINRSQREYSRPERSKNRMKSVAISTKIYDNMEKRRQEMCSMALIEPTFLKKKLKKIQKKDNQRIFYHQKTLPVKPVKPKSNNRVLSISIKNKKLMNNKLKNFKLKMKSLSNSGSISAINPNTSRNVGKIGLTKINIDFSTGKVGLNLKPKTAKSCIQMSKRSKRCSSFNSQSRKNNSKFFKVSNREIKNSLREIRQLVGVKNNLERAIGTINSTLMSLNSPARSKNRDQM